MKAIKVNAEIWGTGTDYYKFVRGLSEKTKDRIKASARNTFFYLKTKGGKKHYKQTGYKVIIYNPVRYEYYHREPSLTQLLTILRKENKIR